jgi:hypothetical protein
MLVLSIVSYFAAALLLLCCCCCSAAALMLLTQNIRAYTAVVNTFFLFFFL